MVPALEVQGQVLIQWPAIIEWLEEQFDSVRDCLLRESHMLLERGATMRAMSIDAAPPALPANPVKGAHSCLRGALEAARVPSLNTSTWSWSRPQR